MRVASQDMRFRCALMKYAKKHGVAQAGRKHHKGRAYMYAISF